MSKKSLENSEQVRELEKAVLGGLMLETERYDAGRLIIDHSDFDDPALQNLNDL
jgi:replicative DNA helicase